MIEKTLRISDNSRKNKTAFRRIKSLTHKIADKTLQQLEHEGVFVFPEKLKESEDITKEQIILRSVEKQYCTGNVMGFIGHEDERLVIQSRFCNKNNDYFLQYLIEKVFDLPNIVDLEIDTNQDNKLFQWLIFLFPYYLKGAARKGIFKMYVRKEYNDGNIKGMINIARHITKNTPFCGKVAYAQREYTQDNYLMELIRHTIEFIKARPYGKKILAKAMLEVKAIIDSTPSYHPSDKNKIIEKNKRNTVRHAYYREYCALQHLCLLILKQQKQQIDTGVHKIYGVLFDGAWLWEENVNTIIGGKFHHPMNKSGKERQYLFENCGWIYPDFISKEVEQRIVADAKYKPIENIRGKDYLQVLAYMYRFDAKIGYYFYPMNDNESPEKLFMNEGTTYENG